LWPDSLRRPGWKAVLLACAAMLLDDIAENPRKPLRFLRPLS
jgi:hypothetical protein